MPASRSLAALRKAAAACRGCDLYDVTNAVKHFSWEPRGKRRIHKKPRASEVRACRPWLEAELDAVRPDPIVSLGATAAQAVMGTAFRLTAHRGEILTGPVAVACWRRSIRPPCFVRPTMTGVVRRSRGWWRTCPLPLVCFGGD